MTDIAGLPDPPLTDAQLSGRLAPIEITGSTTATIDRVHVVTASATLTDPTGAQGRGYEVIVRAGVATIGGIAYPDGSYIRRYYSAGAWANNAGSLRGPDYRTTAFTAVIGGEHRCAGTFAVTDPSGPANGDDFMAIVMSGAVTVGGTAYSIAGTLIRRIWDGAAWSTQVIPNLAGAWTWTGTQTFAAGSAAAPSVAMVDAGLGFYRVSANVGGASASGVASFQWSSTTFDVLRGLLQVIPTTGTAEARVEVGTTRSGDGNSYVDLIGDATYSDYGARLIRYAGANANSEMNHRGTGRLRLVTQDAGDIDVATSNTARGRCYADGGFQWGGTLGTSPGFGQALFGATVTCLADVVRSVASGDGRIVIRSAAAQNKILSFQTGTNGYRWEMLSSVTTDNFQINAYDDSSVYVDTPLTIARAAGGSIVIGGSTGRFVSIQCNAGVYRGATAALFGVSSNAGHSARTSYETAAAGRWQIGKNGDAESTGDAGSNFSILAFADAGSFIDFPLTIARAAGGLITLARPVSVTNTTASTNTTTGSLVVSGGVGIAGAQFIGGSLTVGTSANSINLAHNSQNRLAITADTVNSTLTAGSGQNLGLAAPTGKTVYATIAGVESMRLDAASMFFQPTTALNVNASALGTNVPFTNASNTGVSYPTDISFLRGRASTDLNKGIAGVFGLAIGTYNAPTVAGVHGIGTTTGGDGHAVGIRGEGVVVGGGGIGACSAVGGVFDARSASTTAGKTSYGIKAYASASGASNAASLAGILLQVSPAASSAAAQLADATLTIPSAYTGTTVKGIGVTLNWTGTASTTAATVRGFDLNMTVNQGAALGYNGILVNVTETAVGSGTKMLLNLQTGGTTRFSVSNTGLTTITDATAAISTISAALVVTGGAGIGGAVFVGGNIDTATAFLRGGVQVLGARITGWAAATGTATRTTFDTTTVTTAQLAERVKALIDDFRTHGAIGT